MGFMQGQKGAAGKEQHVSNRFRGVCASVSVCAAAVWT